MKRIREIIFDIRNRYPNDDFFSDFEYSYWINPLKKQHYQAYNRALKALDNESWQILKEKALQHYLNHRKGQKKQGLFNQLNEAFAYRYLATRKGFENVRFIKEGKEQRPDIKFNVQNKQVCCEVKTLGISDDEIKRRSTHSVYNSSVYVRLSDGFLNKFNDAVNAARKQIYTFGTIGLVYIIIRFDDIALDYYKKYRSQLITFCKNQGFDNLFIKIGVIGNRRISITSGFHYTHYLN